MSSLPKISCENCNYVNEGQRIYCHSCGHKLDRTAVVEEERKNETSPGEQQRRIKRLMNPGVKLGWKTLRTAAYTLGLAALVAALVSVALPPKGVPPLPKGLQQAPPLGIRLQQLGLASAGRQAVFTEEEINQYLLGVLHAGPDKSVVRFRRAFVHLGEGAVRITSQMDIKGYPLYVGATYRLKVENGVFSATPAGLQLGRLTIPEAAARHAGPVARLLLKPLWTSLKQEALGMEKIGGVEVGKGQIIFESAGTPPAATR